MKSVRWRVLVGVLAAGLLWSAAPPALAETSFPAEVPSDPGVVAWNVPYGTVTEEDLAATAPKPFRCPKVGKLPKGAKAQISCGYAYAEYSRFGPEKPVPWNRIKWGSYSNPSACEAYVFATYGVYAEPARKRVVSRCKASTPPVDPYVTIRDSDRPTQFRVYNGAPIMWVEIPDSALVESGMDGSRCAGDWFGNHTFFGNAVGVVPGQRTATGQRYYLTTDRSNWLENFAGKGLDWMRERTLAEVDANVAEFAYTTRPGEDPYEYHTGETRDHRVKRYAKINSAICVPFITSDTPL